MGYSGTTAASATQSVLLATQTTGSMSGLGSDRQSGLHATICHLQVRLPIHYIFCIGTRLPDDDDDLCMINSSHKSTDLDGCL